MNINHEALERLAREICDSRNGAGHYDKSGTHRNHWRVKASEMMALAVAMPAYRGLAQACGWQL
ncbi:hypothetical protein EAH75_01345 [Rhodanobacter glycinis]|nr:hypothetical protein EAH75_01345 [Rhodanobacter glycinis]